MASPSTPPEQPSNANPESVVLCDSCKKSVLEPSDDNADLENKSLTERFDKAEKDWLLSRRMWPIGYIVASSYSPFWIEKQLPGRDWRDAFEDLLALESGGEIISDESREREAVTAATLDGERATFLIEWRNKAIVRRAESFKKTHAALGIVMSSGRRAQPSVISWLEEHMERLRRSAQSHIASAHSVKEEHASRQDWSASKRKGRCQWMASLITSGALRDWKSTLKDSEAGHLYYLKKQGANSKDRDRCDISERDLDSHFDDGESLELSLPDPPMYMVPNLPPARLSTDPEILDEDSWPAPPPDRPVLWRKSPRRPCFRSQETSAARITLPDGKTAMRVVMKNQLTNGDVEKKVIIDQPCKVLQEVEKAKALIEDRCLGINGL